MRKMSSDWFQQSDCLLVIQCRQAPQVIDAVWDEVEGSHFKWAEPQSFEQLHDSLQQCNSSTLNII